MTGRAVTFGAAEWKTLLCEFLAFERFYSANVATGRHTIPVNLRKDIVDDFTMDIGEAAVGAVIAEGQFFVIDAEQMENGGVQIVTIRFVFDCAPGPFVTLTISNSRLESRAGHPGNEGAAVMIAANAALAKGHAAKFGRPNQKCLLE